MDYAAELRESHVAPHLAEAATSHWMVHELYSTSLSKPVSSQNDARRWRERFRQTLNRHRSPSFWRRTFNFGATVKPVAPTKKVQLQTLNMWDNK